MARSLLEDVPEQTFTAETIKRMYRLVNQAVTDPAFQKLVYGIVNGQMHGQWKNYRGELSTVLGWFKRNVDYRRDPYGVELLQDVWATLDRGRGDCDDATVWLCAAATILGCPTRIVTVSTRPDKEPVHVYPEAMVGGRWLGLDATVPGSFVGWKPPHVTDTRIWMRSDLGLSGDDDTSTVEGLGMNGNGQSDFGTMTPVSSRLAPGVPDDISKTYADGRPGTTDISGRKIWRAPVANNSEWTSSPRPGGGVYGPALPVKSMPTPRELWYLVDRQFVPKVLNPDSAWWGKVPTSREDFNRMFPGSEVKDMSYLREIASVPASAIAAVEGDVRKQLSMGEIGLADLGDAIQEGLEDYAAGRPLRMQRPPGQRGVRRHGWRKEAAWPGNERRYLVPGPSKGLMASPRALEGLGDVFDDAAKALSTGVQTGSVPPGSIDQAINAVVSQITGVPAVKPPPPSNMLTTLIPMGVLALLGLAAFSMSGGGKSRKYRRNPSRRRSYRRSGGGKGIDPKDLLLWGGGAVAAYFLLLRPGSPLMPAMPRTAVPQQSSLFPGASAVPSLISSISKLFSGGSTSTTSPSGGSQMVTSYSQLQPSQPAPAPSEFVTSL